MNIGIVTSWFERGAAYVSRAFMQSLQELGHDVRIFVRGGMRRTRQPACVTPAGREMPVEA